MTLIRIYYITNLLRSFCLHSNIRTDRIRKQEEINKILLRKYLIHHTNKKIDDKIDYNFMVKNL